MYTKFENNPSRGFWVIALTPLRAVGGGRRVAGGGRLRRKTITSRDPSDTGDIMRADPNYDLFRDPNDPEIGPLRSLFNTPLMSLKLTCKPRLMRNQWKLFEKKDRNFCLFWGPKWPQKLDLWGPYSTWGGGALLLTYKNSSNEFTNQVWSESSGNFTRK